MTGTTAGCPGADLLLLLQHGLIEEPGEERRLCEHLRGCARCASVAAGMGAALAPPPDPEPPQDLLAELEARIEREALEEARTPAEPRDDVRLRCTFCHDGLAARTAVYCAGCLAPQHGECWAEHGRCAAPGCESREVVRRGAGPTPPRRGKRGALLVLGLACAGGAAALAWRGRVPGPPDLAPAVPTTTLDSVSSPDAAALPPPATAVEPPFGELEVRRWRRERLAGIRVGLRSDGDGTRLSQRLAALSRAAGVEVLLASGLRDPAIEVEPEDELGLDEALERLLPDGMTWTLEGPAVLVRAAGDPPHDPREEALPRDLLLATGGPLSERQGWWSPAAELEEEPGLVRLRALERQLDSARVDLSFDQAPLLQALEWTAELAAVEVRLSPLARARIEAGAPNVTLRLRQVPLRDALGLVIAQDQGLALTPGRRGLELHLRDEPAGESALASAGARALARVAPAPEPWPALLERRLAGPGGPATLVGLAARLEEATGAQVVLTATARRARARLRLPAGASAGAALELAGLAAGARWAAEDGLLHLDAPLVGPLERAEALLCARWPWPGAPPALLREGAQARRALERAVADLAVDADLSGTLAAARAAAERLDDVLLLAHRSAALAGLGPPARDWTALAEHGPRRDEVEGARFERQAELEARRQRASEALNEVWKRSRSELGPLEEELARLRRPGEVGPGRGIGARLRELEAELARRGQALAASRDGAAIDLARAEADLRAAAREAQREARAADALEERLLHALAAGLPKGGLRSGLEEALEALGRGRPWDEAFPGGVQGWWQARLTAASRALGDGRHALRKLGLELLCGEGGVRLSVAPAEWAARRGLRTGDLLLSVGGEPTHGPLHALELLAAVPEGVAVDLRVRRGEEELFLRLPVRKAGIPGWPGAWFDDRGPEPADRDRAPLRDPAPRVIRVQPDGPAARALAVGDELLAIDGVRVVSASEALELLAWSPAGRVVSLSVRRGPEERRVQLELAEGPPPLLSAGERGSLTPAERDALEAALAWLARHQEPDGSWSPAGWPARCTGGGCRAAPMVHAVEAGREAHRVGVSALAVLAFLARGEPCEPLERGLTFLLARQGSEGAIGWDPGQPETIYDHAYATLAACEALERFPTREGLRAAAERAVTWCLSARNRGLGWKYGIEPGRNDTSITTTMVEVLAAAGASGLASPEALASARQGALAWVARVTDAQGDVGYETPGGGSSFLGVMDGRFDPLPVMTAAALRARGLLGSDPRDPRVRMGVTALLRNDGQGPRAVNFIHWHWRALAARHLEGGDGQVLRGWTRQALLPLQREAGCARGSWDGADEWSVVGGRVYATAINALTLATPIRPR